MANTKNKNNFSRVVTLATIALFLFMPNFTYCFSKIIKTILYSYDLKSLETDKTKELLDPKNLQDLVPANTNKNIYSNSKSIWLEIIQNNSEKITHLNFQLISTENNLKPPKNFKLTLISNYINKCIDLPYYF